MIFGNIYGDQDCIYVEDDVEVPVQEEQYCGSTESTGPEEGHFSIECCEEVIDQKC